ncbi:MAG: exosortase-dependent surface protein XDP1, partial [Halioglobus sp.]|nr:exosortase-dependent surface protein XDP1 [Halioglobus sp.]
MSYKGLKTAGALAVCVAALQAAPAYSAMQTWDWSSSTTPFTGGDNFGNSVDMSVGGINLSVTGWSDTNDTTTPDSIETAKLNWQQSGASLGMENQDETTQPPDHSIDSVSTDQSGGSRDGLLLTFDTAVTLDGLDLTWAVGAGTDMADISILAWDGTGSAGLAGQDWASILDSNGGNYTSVGNYQGVGLSYYAIGTAVESTSWLIAAYNPVFGGGDPLLDFGDDGFKIDLVQTSTQGDLPPGEAPVPGSAPLLLLGLALLGRGVSNRR